MHPQEISLPKHSTPCLRALSIQEGRCVLIWLQLRCLVEKLHIFIVALSVRLANPAGKIRDQNKKGAEQRLLPAYSSYVTPQPQDCQIPFTKLLGKNICQKVVCYILLRSMASPVMKKDCGLTSKNPSRLMILSKHVPFALTPSDGE